MEWLGIHPIVIVASLVGGIISLYFFDGREKPDGSHEPVGSTQKLVIVLGGTAMGVFCTAIVTEGLELKNASAKLEAGIGLILAAVGMSILAKVLKVDYQGIVESWLKKGT